MEMEMEMEGEGEGGVACEGLSRGRRGGLWTTDPAAHSAGPRNSRWSRQDSKPLVLPSPLSPLLSPLSSLIGVCQYAHNGAMNDTDPG